MLLNSINPFSLSKRIGRPLILDGAMGSLLQQMSAEADGKIWMSLINLKNPDMVLNAHKQYIKAGADIITTNTFRTNPAAVEKYSKRINVNSLVKKSVDLAIEAAKGLPVYVAGSNPPAEDSYQLERRLTSKKLKENHLQHIDLLMESGCHIVLNETQNHFDEIKIICSHCSRNNIPYVLSIFFDENFRLYSGEKADYVLKFIADYSPLAAGINCIKPDTFLKYFNKHNLNFNWGFYLNCGKGEFSDTNIIEGVSPYAYINVVKEVILKKPSFIGACCGSTPAHIKIIKEYLDGKHKN